MMRQATPVAAAVIAFAVCCLGGCSGRGGSELQAGTEPASTLAPSETQLHALLDAEFRRLGVDPQTKAVSAPTGVANSAFDLGASLIDPDGRGGDPASGLRLSWTERLVGDYNQDGQVLVSDLTPLGLNYQRTVRYATPEEYNGIATFPRGNPLETGVQDLQERPARGTGAENWRLARVDGDSNGVVAINDLTPIGIHFRERLDGYRIYRRAPGESELTLLPNAADPESPMTLTRAQSSLGGGPDTGRPVIYTFDDALTVQGHYEYQVAPYDIVSDSEGPRSIIGIDSGGQPLPDPYSADFSYSDPIIGPPKFDKFLLIRNDNGVYDTNYRALLSDLQAIPVLYDEIDYSDDVNQYFGLNGYTRAIWYRGGPSADAPAEPTQSTHWTDAEIDAYVNILQQGGRVLMLSQNNAVSDNSVITDPQVGNGWDWLQEQGRCTTLPNAADYEQRRLGWAAGLATDNGLGYTQLGYLRTGGSAALAGVSTYVDQDDPSAGQAGECFTGTGSSQRLPAGIEIPGTTQFFAIGYWYGALGNSNCTGPGFSSGFSFDPYVGVTLPKDLFPSDTHTVFASALLSYGNSQAPTEDMGGAFDPYDQTHNGPGRVWVIGYSWNDVEVVPQESESMSRTNMLQNVLAWLSQ